MVLAHCDDRRPMLEEVLDGRLAALHVVFKLEVELTTRTAPPRGVRVELGHPVILRTCQRGVKRGGGPREPASAVRHYNYTHGGVQVEPGEIGVHVSLAGGARLTCGC